MMGLVARRPLCGGGRLSPFVDDRVRSSLVVIPCPHRVVVPGRCGTTSQRGVFG